MEEEEDFIYEVAEGRGEKGGQVGGQGGEAAYVHLESNESFSTKAVAAFQPIQTPPP